MTRIGPNDSQIGRPGSRRALQTPALVLDLNLLDANMERMRRLLAGRRVGLRPHTKTHKSVRIAKMQLDAGAVGVCCATVGEAEVLVEGGITDVLVTSPAATPAKCARLVRMSEQTGDLMAVVDHRSHIEGLEAATARKDAHLAVLVELDLGGQRQGVSNPHEAETLARLVHDSSYLSYRGLQAYAGQVQHIRDYYERLETARQTHERIACFRDHLASAGLAPTVISGGGTGSIEFELAGEVLTDIQAGSYVFMDVQYNDLAHRENGAGRFTNALFVATTVISINAPGLATTDAGYKSFATDGPLPRIFSAAPPGSTYRFFGDEHGQVVLPPDAPPLEIGDHLECVVPHCDPTVNLHDVYHCVRGDTLVNIWPVDARGRSC